VSVLMSSCTTKYSAAVRAVEIKHICTERGYIILEIHPMWKILVAFLTRVQM
jgi:hypothetical protein